MEYKNEEWRDIPGFEGKYQVSDMGRARSIPRVIQSPKGPQKWPGKMLKPFLDSNGYLHINLAQGGSGGGAKKCTLHSVVLTAFKGSAPIGMEACHNDGNRENATLSNLRWDTRINNAADRKRHGTHRTNAKLQPWQVNEIRSRTETSGALANIYGVASSTIRAIKIGQNWNQQN